MPTGAFTLADLDHAADAPPATGQRGKYTLSDLDGAPEQKPSVAHDFLKYSPVGVLQGLADAIRDPKHAISAILESPSQNVKLLDKAKESYKGGDYTGAAAHFLNYLMPGGAAMEDAGEDFQKGDIAHGVAKTAGMASTLVTGAKAPAILDAATSAELPALPSVKSALGVAKDVHAVVSSGNPLRRAAAAKSLFDKIKARVATPEAAAAPDATSTILQSMRRSVAEAEAEADSAALLREDVPAVEEPAAAAAAPRAAAQPFSVPAGSMPDYGALMEQNEPPQWQPGPRVEPPAHWEPFSGEVERPATPAAQAAAPTEAPTLAQHKTELEDLLERSLQDPHISRIAKVELDQHLKEEAAKKTVSIIDKHQTRRALKMGRFLQDHGITTEHIEAMTPAEWHQVGELADVLKPSATTIQKTKDLLNMAAENAPKVSTAAAGAGQ